MRCTWALERRGTRLCVAMGHGVLGKRWAESRLESTSGTGPTAVGKHLTSTSGSRSAMPRPPQQWQDMRVELVPRATHPRPQKQKGRTYPELFHSSPCHLVVFGVDGWAGDFLRQLARVKDALHQAALTAAACRLLLLSHCTCSIGSKSNMHRSHQQVFSASPVSTLLGGTWFSPARPAADVGPTLVTSSAPGTCLFPAASPCGGGRGMLPTCFGAACFRGGFGVLMALCGQKRAWEKTCND